ncbi:MAG: hypothetical protein HUU21_36000 [Polyangiaceae bacterium]|nr:hypothetical protein [Polyangiaceae bacterium]
MTKRRDFKARARALKAETGEPSYMAAARKVRNELLKDPTKIVSDGVARELRKAWPGTRVDVTMGGLFAAEEPPVRVFDNHFLSAHVPMQNGAVEVEIELSTDEIKPGSSIFGVNAKIDNQEDDAIDRRVDLLSPSKLRSLFTDIQARVHRRIALRPSVERSETSSRTAPSDPVPSTPPALDLDAGVLRMSISLKPQIPIQLIDAFGKEHVLSVDRELIEPQGAQGILPISRIIREEGDNTLVEIAGKYEIWVKANALFPTAERERPKRRAR